MAQNGNKNALTRGVTLFFVVAVSILALVAAWRVEHSLKKPVPQPAASTPVK